jgi:hypothetical protein
MSFLMTLVIVKLALLATFLGERYLRALNDRADYLTRLEDWTVVGSGSVWTDLRTGCVQTSGKAERRWLAADTREMRADMACNYSGRRADSIRARYNALRDAGIWLAPLPGWVAEAERFEADGATAAQAMEAAA